MIFCFTGTAVFCFAAAFIPETTDTGKTLVVVTAILARLFLVGVYSFLGSALVTLYPTIIRNNGVSWAYGVARLAGVLVPQIVLLQQVLELTER